MSNYFISNAHYLENQKYKFCLISEKERGGHTYVEAKLNKALSERLKDLDDKIENAEHSRSFFGDEMYKKLIEIDASRGEALVHDRGMIHFDGYTDRFQFYSPQ